MVPLLDAIEGVANESMAVYSSLCIESENNEAFDKLQVSMSNLLSVS